MVISCPKCRAKYRIKPSNSMTNVARVKCPACSHLFQVSLVAEQSAASPSAAVDQVLRPQVLVVDDARFFREMIRDILKDLPVEIITAADGDEAWSMIKAQAPQLVLLDLNIPGKNGREILQDLQQSMLAAKVRVVAMSAVERGEVTASEMRRLGAIDFFNKSFTPAELQKRVRTLLDI